MLDPIEDGFIVGKHFTPRIAAPNQRRRRKTIAFGNEENTPPTAVSMDVTNYHPLKERRITQQGSTICSVKDMDVSSTTMQAASRDEVAKLSSYGTTMNVSGASSSVSAGTLHRRTLFIPSVEGAMDARNSAGMTSCHEVSSIMSERQRTFCTPGNSTPIDPLEVSETPPDMSGVETRSHLTHADGSSIANRPNPVSSSTPQSLVSNGGDRRKTLLEQYNDTLTFSSTRAPNIRRRTVFDITMDIMDHRLSEINRQAAAARAEGQQTPARNTAAPATQQQDNPGLQSPPPLAVQTSLDTYYRKSAKSCEKSATSSVAIEAPKKRKLFNIQPTGTDSPIAEVRQIAAVTPKTASKRRSLAPVVAEGSKSITASAKKRRTTGIFESPAQQRVQGSSKSLFPIGRGLPTMVSQRPQPRQYLATTNLHSEQNAFVQEAIASLNGFLVEPNVTDNTTHLVTLETRRTINLLRALIRGLWIVRYEWIVDSYRAGCWLPEESFELRDFSVAVQINRSERQAFGSCYRNELFGDYGPFWVSPGCTVPELQLRELVLLCRGKITRNRTQARFIVVEPNDPALDDVDGAPNEQLYVTPLWILDSITINRVKKLSRKYRLR
ncbi:mediator of DNA damage checkpoint protein 1-like [Anopheles nili]|uniref:mediator of DNA damage checkpoint protein 1-like n=1 Tax=Anopheles nili TaxID=185578 RepID=UPI00237C4171|nr:mediator of DNA damage checkpoint protein 1-like [Anopheles nili]